MTSAGHMTNNGDEQQYSADQSDHSDDGVDRNENEICASGSSQLRQRVQVATVTGNRLSLVSVGSPETDYGGSAGRCRGVTSSSASEKPRCERHGDRDAELYCQSCEVPICVPCATTRHPPTSGHNCWDVADAVDQCRSKLAQRACDLEGRRLSCLNRIEDTKAKIESIRSKLCYVCYYLPQKGCFCLGLSVGLFICKQD